MLDSQQLRSRLEAGISELEADIGRLRAALIALDRTESAVAGPARRSAPARARRRRSDRSAADGETASARQLTQLLCDSAMTTSELAARTGRSSEQVLRRLKELEQTGEAHRTGHRRSTRWHVGPAGATPVAGDEPDAVAL